MQFHTCCFTGHRELSPTCERALTEILDRRLEALFAIGFTEFRTGGALGFDTLAAERTLLLTEEYQEKLAYTLFCAIRQATSDPNLQS